MKNKEPGKKAKKEIESKEVRLNKYIADAGITSRRKADELISTGAVKINGQTVTELGTKVLPGDKVTVNGNPVSDVRHHYKYILLNKPKDYITTTSDEFGRKTVMDLVRSGTRIYPVGRLDRNTTGTILLTNDGELANRLTHPSYHIERIYNAGLDRELNAEDAKKIAKGGITLENEVTAPCKLFIHPDDHTKVTLTLTEGKNREIHRIFESLGYKVKKLDRKFFAGLSNSGLKRGQYRHLTRGEVMSLKKLVKL